MDKRYLDNPFDDYQNDQKIEYDENHVKNLICTYVDAILKATQPTNENDNHRGDLYVGNSGIAYMFWRLSRSQKTNYLYPALDHAHTYIRSAKANVNRYNKRPSKRYAFLCGSAGIYAVSAVISKDLNKTDDYESDLAKFREGISSAKEFVFTKDCCDEMLVGRAGYLSGCYWLNDVLTPKPISDDEIISICEITITSGREYAEQNKTPFPLMYKYHGTEYLGAAHGLCGILHMLIESPSYSRGRCKPARSDKLDIKKSIDYFLSLQDAEGNFPVSLEDLKTGSKKRLVHWCHGAPGAVYLLARAYLVFREEKYLDAVELAADLVWNKGFLRKGPGICHGVAGNGYVFLLLYRLTKEPKYMYRAVKFMELLTNSDFKERSRIPDRPHSLYEGSAGTVCFLIDLLEPNKAHFPFMDIFHERSHGLWPLASLTTHI